MLSILNIVAKKLKVHLLIFISSIIISILLFQNFTWGKNTTSVITLAQLLMCWMIGYCATWPSIVHGFKEKADHFSPFSFKGYFCISSCCCWKKINVAIPIEKKKNGSVDWFQLLWDKNFVFHSIEMHKVFGALLITGILKACASPDPFSRAVDEVCICFFVSASSRVHLNNLR